MLDEVKVIEKEIHKIVNQLRNSGSKIDVLTSDVDELGTKTIKLCGGLNGNGNWSKYLRDLASLVDEISKEYKIWLIKLNNDVVDDIFYATFGIEKK